MSQDATAGDGRPRPDGNMDEKDYLKKVTHDLENDQRPSSQQSNGHAENGHAENGESDVTLDDAGAAGSPGESVKQNSCDAFGETGCVRFNDSTAVDDQSSSDLTTMGVERRGGEADCSRERNKLVSRKRKATASPTNSRISRLSQGLWHLVLSNHQGREPSPDSHSTPSRPLYLKSIRINGITVSCVPVNPTEESSQQEECHMDTSGGREPHEHAASEDTYVPDEEGTNESQLPTITVQEEEEYEQDEARLIYSIEDSPRSPDPPEENMDDGEIALLQKVDQIMSNGVQHIDEDDEDDTVIIEVPKEPPPRIRFNEIARSDTDDPCTMAGVMRENMKEKGKYRWSTLENIALHIIEERERIARGLPLNERERTVQFHESVMERTFTKWDASGRKIPLSDCTSVLREVPLIDHQYDGHRRVKKVHDRGSKSGDDSSQYDTNGASADVKERLGRHLRNKRKVEAEKKKKKSEVDTYEVCLAMETGEGVHDADELDFDDDEDLEEDQDQITDGLSMTHLVGLDARQTQQNVVSDAGREAIEADSSAYGNLPTDELGYRLQDGFPPEERTLDEDEIKLRRLRRKRKLDAEISMDPCCSKFMDLPQNSRQSLLGTPPFALPVVPQQRMPSRVVVARPNTPVTGSIEQIQANIAHIIQLNQRKSAAMARAGENLLRDLRKFRLLQCWQQQPVIEHSSSYTDASELAPPNQFPFNPESLNTAAHQEPTDPSNISLYDPTDSTPQFRSHYGQYELDLSDVSDENDEDFDDDDDGECLN
uniref:Myb-like domain-containing protein n=1 Tax=Steinernema glaseri TaxID=37863 RepID=A0A1I8A8N6_9BILA